jgi:hypothetical protein
MMTQRDITLSITFTLDDIEVLQRIWNRYGYAMDETGIISHIINEYEMRTADSLNIEVKA